MNKKFNKSFLLILFILTIFLLNIDVVDAATTFRVCEKSGIVKVFQILGYALFIIKILAPLALMAFGVMDFAKAILASDDNAIKNATTIIVKRVIAAIVIFFVPSIISTAIKLVDGVDELKDFTCLSECISKPSSASCKIPNNIIFE